VMLVVMVVVVGVAALDGQAMAYQALLRRIGPHSRQRFRPGSQI
jgi:hypothetical protein